MAKEFAMKRKRFSVEQIVVVLLVAELNLNKAILQDINSEKWSGPR
jgi:hypothetical protein